MNALTIFFLSPHVFVAALPWPSALDSVRFVAPLCAACDTTLAQEVMPSCCCKIDSIWSLQGISSILAQRQANFNTTHANRNH